MCNPHYERKLSAELAKMGQQLTDLDKRLVEAEKSPVFAGCQFRGLNPFQMEEYAVPVLTLLIRCSVLLTICQVELDWIEEQGDPKTIASIKRLRAKIQKMRETHVNGAGYSASQSFRDELLAGGKSAATKVNDLDSLLIRFFGYGVDSKSENGGFAAQRLDDILRVAGDITYHPKEAASLTEALRNIPQNSPVQTPNIANVHTFEDLITSISKKINRLLREMKEVIKEYELDDKTKAEDDLFHDWSLCAVRDNCAHIQQRFSRCALLLNCFEAQLRLMAQEYSLTLMPGDVKGKLLALYTLIFEVREVYIGGYGAKATNSLRNRLGIPPTLDASVNSMDKFLIYAFGTGISKRGDNNCSAVRELCEMFITIGNLTGKTEEANDILSNLLNLNI